MIATSSVTYRIQLAMSLALTFVVLVLGAGSYLAFGYLKDNVLNEHLNEVVQQLETVKPDASGALSLDQRHRHLAWFLATGEQGANDVPAEFSALTAGTHELNWQQEQWRVRVLDREDGRIITAATSESFRQRQTEFGLLILACMTFCLLMVWLTAGHLAALASGPMIRLVHMLSQRSGEQHQYQVANDNEMGRLLGAFNVMQSRLEEELYEEREMALNLGHELNTALCAIRSEAEMLLLTGQGGGRSRLENIIRQADIAAAGLQSAQNLASIGRSHKQECCLSRYVDDAWGSLPTGAGKTLPHFRNEVPESLRLNLDPSALLVVIRNLLQNVVDHARASDVVVSAPTPTTLMFKDNGQGIAADRLERLFERHFHQGARSSPQTGRRGLGMDIVRQICLYHGWTLRVQSDVQGAQRGTRFYLELE
ncbi:sensor histidine kinase [Alcaligenes sp. SDU_A2]|uniref:sensor histidine kinase n=1 Tax=Alcaligenes sp. SDU_A2 TaxID=3136634 RepID=UPI002CBE1ACD|nr:HAMP domain-containing sensor histidine kinase [Alcaligenes sp.]HRL27468.1 HAMP domain-containing sensor histidine kinase [Alcaligenes sp.]